MSSVLVETLAAWQELSVTAGIWAFFVGKEEMKLKSYIKEDLRRRIQSGQDVPQPLTLANLSEQYGVSFTPVRMALGELIQEGWICKKQANGRLEINSKK